jgi:hypothetical protein
MKEKYSLIYFFSPTTCGLGFHQRGRKRPKRSLSSIAPCSRMCSAAFSQVQHRIPHVTIHCISICLQYVRGRVCWVVLETLYWRTFTLCMGPNSKSTKLLDHPHYKSLGGLRGLRKIYSCPKSFSRLLLLHCFL